MFRLGLNVFFGPISETVDELIQPAGHPIAKSL